MEKSVCRALISAILVTSEWKRVLDIIKLYNSFRAIDPKLYSSVVVRAFQQNDTESGWNLLKIIISLNQYPTCESFVAYWDYCKRHPTSFVENLERMLEFIGKNKIFISKLAVDELNNVLAEMRFKSKYSMIIERFVETCLEHSTWIKPSPLDC